MVEAALVMPYVIITIAVMIVISLMKFQDTVVLFTAQRESIQMSRELMYPGYEKYIGHSMDMSIDIESTSIRNVSEFYKRKNLYHNFSGYADNVKGLFEKRTNQFLKDFSFLSGMQTETNINVVGGISPLVKIEIVYHLKLPGFVKFMKLDDRVTFPKRSYSLANNPTEFVRNVDLAYDASTFLFRVLGINEDVGSFLEKAKTIMEMFGL